MTEHLRPANKRCSLFRFRKWCVFDDTATWLGDRCISCTPSVRNWRRMSRNCLGSWRDSVSLITLWHGSVDGAYFWLKKPKEDLPEREMVFPIHITDSRGLSKMGLCTYSYQLPRVNKCGDTSSYADKPVWPEILQSSLWKENCLRASLKVLVQLLHSRNKCIWS